MISDGDRGLIQSQGLRKNIISPLVGIGSLSFSFLLHIFIYLPLIFTIVFPLFYVPPITLKERENKHDVCFYPFASQKKKKKKNTANTVTRNSTLLSSGTYWGQFEEIGKYNTNLNVAERLWAAWYAWMQNDVLATGIMSFVMHELVYFGRSLPWIFIDTLGLFNRYKIQGVSQFRVRSPIDDTLLI